MLKAKYSVDDIVNILGSQYEVNYVWNVGNIVYANIDKSIEDIPEWLNSFGFDAVLKAYGSAVDGIPVEPMDIETSIKFMVV